jgi:hypothetical protein
MIRRMRTLWYTSWQDGSAVITCGPKRRTKTHGQ